ncbi:MAG: UDP-3-O-acyl-N-acetylglucosamine deacetylase [Pirellulales bacterium]
MKSRPRHSSASVPVQPKPRFQNTIAREAVVEGFGFWSSRDVRVEFRPAAADSGVVFVRCDLNPAVRIAAAVERRVETPRRTALVHGTGRVEMVEHILAALAGLQIDNCEVWVNECEMPGGDGSSLAFVEALEAAGIVRQQAIRATLVVRETVRLGNEDCWIVANPPQQTGLAMQFRIEYPDHPSIGRQTFKLALDPNAFRTQLASSRTFLTQQEAEWLRGQGLAARATTKDALVFDADGPLENELRFVDECVRHKMLDLVGDLALAGCDIVAQITAHCSGHRLNSELVRALLAEGEKLQPWLRCA